MQVDLSLVPPQEALRDIRQSHGAELEQNQFVARPDFGIRGASEALGVLSPSASAGFWCLPGGMSPGLQPPVPPQPRSPESAPAHKPRAQQGALVP